MQPRCIPLRDLRHLRENIHMRVLNQYTQKKTQCLPQISQIYADEPQNNRTTITKQTAFLCAICERISETLERH